MCVVPSDQGVLSCRAPARLRTGSSVRCRAVGARSSARASKGDSRHQLGRSRPQAAHAGRSQRYAPAEVQARDLAVWPLGPRPPAAPALPVLLNHPIEHGLSRVAPRVRHARLARCAASGRQHVHAGWNASLGGRARPVELRCVTPPAGWRRSEIFRTAATPKAGTSAQPARTKR